MSAEKLSNVELIFWNMPVANQPTVAKVRAELTAAGLNPDRAEDIPHSTAFRRAADDLKANSLLIRCRDDFVQIDREKRQEGKRKLNRTTLGCYYLNGEGIAAEDGAAQDLLVMLQARYAANVATYCWGDVSHIINRILKLDSLGAYSPRRAGGVYFAPFKSKEVLEKIEKFATAVGMRFLRYEVPGSEMQRAEVSEAIEAVMEEEITSHREAIDAYSIDTKPGVVSNRWEALAETMKHINRVKQFLLEEAQARLKAKLDELDELLAKKEVEVNDAYAAGLQHKGRKIAGVTS